MKTKQTEEIKVTSAAFEDYPVGSIIKLIVTEQDKAIIINEQVYHKITTPIDTEQQISQMIEIISVCSNVPIEIMASKTRKREVVFARQIAFYFLRKRFNRFENISLNVVGKHLNRDHSTVLHSCEVIQNAIETNDSFVMPMFNKCHVALKQIHENYLLV